MQFYHSRSSLQTLRILIVVSAFVGTPVDASEGFVLRSGEGEDLDGMLVKASPETGTTGSILIQQTFSAGAKTSLHVHDQGDELFYVIAGQGEATLGEQTVSIGAGDVILAPRGTHHRIRNVSDDSELDIVFFMDRPELLDQFRAMHERRLAEPNRPLTSEEWREILSIGGMRWIER